MPRVLDVLNQPMEGFLALEEVTLISLLEEAPNPREIPEAIVSKRRIALVVAGDEGEGPRGLRPAWVQKRPIRIILGMHLFTICGTVYLGATEKAEPRNFAGDAGFFAVTDAVLDFLPNPGHQKTQVTLLVNKEMVVFAGFLPE